MQFMFDIDGNLIAEEELIRGSGILVFQDKDGNIDLTAFNRGDLVFSYSKNNGDWREKFSFDKGYLKRTANSDKSVRAKSVDRLYDEKGNLKLIDFSKRVTTYYHTNGQLSMVKVHKANSVCFDKKGNIIDCPED